VTMDLAKLITPKKNTNSSGSRVLAQISRVALGPCVKTINQISINVSV